MTPANAIAMLDRQMAEHGQPVVLRRVAANLPTIEKAVAAFVRGYKSYELVGGIQQGDTMVIISPTTLAGSPFASAIPRSGDKMTFDGRLRNVQMVDLVTIAGTVVRINIQVRG